MNECSHTALLVGLSSTPERAAQMPVRWFIRMKKAEQTN
jgi:hypothetical protein